MLDAEELKEIEEAVNRLEEHTQHFVPVDDLWALNLAIEALREKLGE